MTEYKFPYHGLERAFRARLSVPDGAFPDQKPPFCLLNLLGQFLERIDDAFDMSDLSASVGVPVVSRGEKHLVRVRLEARVNWQDKDLYDEMMDHVQDISCYQDGTVNVINYDGPAQWRTEDWTHAEIALTGLGPC